MSREAVSEASREELPRWLWLGTPLAVFVIPYAVRALAPERYESWIRTEYGFIENTTVLFLAVAVVTAILVLRRARELPFAWLAPCVTAFAIGAFYFLGEELSWGQHLFGWRTPEALAGINEQGETNLHNIGGLTESLLDQLPRLLLTIAAAVAGVLMPLAFARSRATWDPRTSARYWIWPSRVVVVAALLALFARVPGKIADRLAGDGDEQTVWSVHGGESKECFLALFLMLVILALLVRARRYREQATGAAG